MFPLLFASNPMGILGIWGIVTSFTSVVPPSSCRSFNVAFVVFMSGFIRGTVYVVFVGFMFGFFRSR